MTQVGIIEDNKKFGNSCRYLDMQEDMSCLATESVEEKLEHQLNFPS